MHTGVYQKGQEHKPLNRPRTPKAAKQRGRCKGRSTGRSTGRRKGKQADKKTTQKSRKATENLHTKHKAGYGKRKYRKEKRF